MRVATLFGRAGVPWRALVAVVACLSVFDVTLGLTYPLLALILEARGVDTVTIGLNAAMTPLGLIAASPFIPSVARRMGVGRFTVACIISTAAILALFKLLPGLPAWFALRLLLGVAISGLFTVSETWINELATGANRGRVVALYGSLLAAGFAAGPFVLARTGTEGWAPFLVGIGCALGALIPLFATRRSIPAPPEEGRASVLVFFKDAPFLLAAVGVFAIFDTVTLSLLPLYALRNGLDQATAANALGVLIAGNIVLQYPIGWLGDRFPRRWVMVGCAALSAAGGVLLPAVLHSVFLWPMLFVWGAAAFGIYTMAMSELGDRFTGSRLLAGSAAFAAMWGVGGIIGPPLTGQVMQSFGPEGLPLTLASICGALAIFAAARRFRGCL